MGSNTICSHVDNDMTHHLATAQIEYVASQRPGRIARWPWRFCRRTELACESAQRDIDGEGSSLSNH
jgi:hypothetical protein